MKFWVTRGVGIGKRDHSPFSWKRRDALCVDGLLFSRSVDTAFLGLDSGRKRWRRFVVRIVWPNGSSAKDVESHRNEEGQPFKANIH
jgi:hypothetical protein